MQEQGISYYRTEVKTFCQTPSMISVKKFIALDDIDTINEQSQQVLEIVLINIVIMLILLHHVVIHKKLLKVSIKNNINKVKTGK